MTTYVKLIAVLLVGLLAVWSPGVSIAADCVGSVDSNADNVIGQIQDASSRCLGGQDDASPIAVKISKLVEPKATACVAKTRTEITSLRNKLATAAHDIEAEALVFSSHVPAEWGDLTLALGSELRHSTVVLADIDQVPEKSVWTWNGTDTIQRGGQFAISYRSLVTSACPMPANTRDRQKCSTAVNAAVEVNRLVNLTSRLHDCATVKDLEDARKRLSELDKKWTAYFFKTRSQFVWELALNSWRFKGKDNMFAEPPSDQVILLHPGVAYEFVGNGAQNSQSYAPIVMAEAIGYNRFDWGKGSALPPLGASLVATYAPSNAGSHFGYGVLFHVYNLYSFGVTRRDTGNGSKDTTVLLSIDLMRAILNPSPDTMKDFRKAGTPASAADQ